MMARADISSNLREKAPSSSNRYDDTQVGQGKKRVIPVGPLNVQDGDDKATQPFGPVPEGWVEHVHVVEGIPFFYNKESKVVTDAYIRVPRILAEVEYWYSQIMEPLRKLDNSENGLSKMDIYIEPMHDSQTGEQICRYYLIDHSKCSIAFLRPISTEVVGLPDVRSNIHLERVLAGEYWTHCEYMPRPDVDHYKYAKKLQVQLRALMIDSISSEGSTSPFTPEECKSYLQGIEETNEAQFLNWSVARINSLIIQSQIINLHGEQCARADRTVVVTGQRPSIRSASYIQCSKMMFDWPVTHLDRLENVWVDRVIYSHHWRKLLSQVIEEWVAAICVAGLVWVSNAILLSNAPSTVAILLLGASTVSTVFGAFKGLMLIRSHRAMGQYAAHGSQFLQSNEKYGTGLQNLAVEYSYPWACTLWGGGLTSLAVLWVVFTKLLGIIAGLLALLGSLSPAMFGTGLLMAGAWAYGRGMDPRQIMNPNFSSNPPAPAYMTRTR